MVLQLLYWQYITQHHSVQRFNRYIIWTARSVVIILQIQIINPLRSSVSGFGGADRNSFHVYSETGRKVVAESGWSGVALGNHTYIPTSVFSHSTRSVAFGCISVRFPRVCYDVCFVSNFAQYTEFVFTLWPRNRKSRKSRYSVEKDTYTYVYTQSHTLICIYIQ